MCTRKTASIAIVHVWGTDSTIVPFEIKRDIDLPPQNLSN